MLLVASLTTSLKLPNALYPKSSARFMHRYVSRFFRPDHVFKLRKSSLVFNAARQAQQFNTFGAVDKALHSAFVAAFNATPRPFFGFVDNHDSETSTRSTNESVKGKLLLMSAALTAPNFGNRLLEPDGLSFCLSSCLRWRCQ